MIRWCGDGEDFCNGRYGGDESNSDDNNELWGAGSDSNDGFSDYCNDGDEHHGAGSDDTEAWCPQRELLYQITTGLQAEDSSLLLTLMR